MKTITAITMLSVLVFFPTQNKIKKEIKPLKGTALRNLCVLCVSAVYFSFYR